MTTTSTAPVVRRRRFRREHAFSAGAVWLLIGLFIALDRHMFGAIFPQGPLSFDGGALLRFIVVVALGPLNPFMSWIMGVLNSIPTR